MADFSGVENGTSELWLIQMPRSVLLDTINDTDIAVEQHGGKIIVKGSIASTLPTKGRGLLIAAARCTSCPTYMQTWIAPSYSRIAVKSCLDSMLFIHVACVHPVHRMWRTVI